MPNTAFQSRDHTLVILRRIVVHDLRLVINAALGYKLNASRLRYNREWLNLIAVLGKLSNYFSNLHLVLKCGRYS